MARRHLLALLATALASLVLAAAALAVMPEQGLYFGETSQGEPVALKVNAKPRVKEFRIEYRAPCEGPGRYTGGVVDTHRPKKNDRIKQNPDGSFSGSGKFTEPAGGGLKGKVTYEYNGTFDASMTASGKFKVKVRVVDDGETLTTCKKSVKWEAD